MNEGYVLAGALTGFMVGLTGVGGGALMTPILLLVFGIRTGSTHYFEAALLMALAAPPLWQDLKAQRACKPGVAPGQGSSTYRPGWAFSSAWPAASTMPSLMPNFILRGARLATITVSLPSRSSGL